MGRKLFLPLTIRPPDPAPTIDVVRRKLGGRDATDAGAGEIVALEGASGERAGVVLFARGDELHVWMEDGFVHKVQRAAARALGEGERSLPAAIAAVARDVRAFLALGEGQRVRFLHDGGTGEGSLLEKCRFGGLVERADGAVLGVGFRRLWAAATGEPS
jgi:hypothetical protein